MKVAYSYNETAIVVIATQERKHHPLANLVDFYKLFFQSYYGQGHFVSNDITAKLKLESELQIMNSSYYPYIQDISNRTGLYRVSLDAIKKGIITVDDFLVMFLNKKEFQINWATWSENWELIKNLIVGLYPVLNDKVHISHCEQAIKNMSMVSHSEVYRLNYQPHYRVMQLSEFEILKFSTLREYL
jgi:hypothetical protein